MMRRPHRLSISPDKLVAGFFLLLIFYVGAATAIFYKSVRRRMIENAGAVQANSSLVARIHNQIDAFETAFSERVYMRSVFAAVDVHLNYFITGRIVSRQVLQGKYDWLFFQTTTDGNPIADFQGTNHYSDDDLRDIRQNLIKLRTEVANRNARLIILISPNKEHIYDMFMPDSVPRINPKSRADLLVQHLEEHGELEVVYPKEEFLSLRHNFMLYHKYDTHWNQLGAFVAVQQVLGFAFGSRKNLEDQLIKNTGFSNQRDLADLLGMSWYFNDDPEYCVATLKQPEYFPDNETHFNPNATHSTSVLLYGDSFREALKPVMWNEFSKIHVVHRWHRHSPYLMDRLQPDLVIVQCAERYLDALKDFNPF
jgi:alginate O-acetyltransferase complex protein AlgJ